MQDIILQQNSFLTDMTIVPATGINKTDKNNSEQY